jgi:hypothetical protein
MLTEKQQISILLSGLTLQWLEPMIYHTRGEHTNHYTTDGVENNIDDIKSTKTIVAVGFLFKLNFFTLFFSYTTYI